MADLLIREINDKYCLKKLHPFDDEEVWWLEYVREQHAGIYIVGGHIIKNCHTNKYEIWINKGAPGFRNAPDIKHCKESFEDMDSVIAYVKIFM